MHRQRNTPSPSTRRSLSFLAAALVGLATSCASLDEEYDLESSRPMVGDGGRVIGISGNYAYREDDVQEREQFALRFTIDEHITDEHVVGGYLLGQFSNQEVDSDGREQIWGGIHYHYHYHLSRRTSIFAGPSLGLTYFDDERSNDGSLTYGISGGIRHWLTERAALTIEPTYLRANYDSASGGDADELLVLWGLAYSL